MKNLIEYLDILKVFHEKITSYFAFPTDFIFFIFFKI